MATAPAARTSAWGGGGGGGCSRAGKTCSTASQLTRPRCATGREGEGDARVCSMVGFLHCRSPILARLLTWFQQGPQGKELLRPAMPISHVCSASLTGSPHDAVTRTSRSQYEMQRRGLSSPFHWRPCRKRIVLLVSHRCALRRALHYARLLANARSGDRARAVPSREISRVIRGCWICRLVLARGPRTSQCSLWTPI